MERAADSGQSGQRGRGRYGSRIVAALVALLLNGALVYLFTALGGVRTPEAPTVEPMLAALIVEPRRIHVVSPLAALAPHLVRPVFRPPKMPPDFRIDGPAEEPAPQKPSDPQLGTGSASSPRVTEDTGEGAGITILHYVPAVYSATAASSYEHGTVVLQVLVDQQGKPSQVHVLESSGFPLLDRAAADAVRQYRFSQTLEGSQPVQVWTRVRQEFELLPMPVPTTIAPVDPAIAKQVALARRANLSYSQDFPDADAYLKKLAAHLLEALSKASASSAPAQQTRSSPTPTEVFAAQGRVTSVRFLGFANPGFGADIPLSTVSARGDSIGSRLSRPTTVRCEIFEVKQASGVSYWLAMVDHGGQRLRAVEIAVATEPLRARGGALPTESGGLRR